MSEAIENGVKAEPAATEQGVYLSVTEYRFLLFGLPFLLLAVLAGSVFWLKKTLDEELISRPPIAVIPVSKAVLAKVKSSDDPDALNKAMREVSDAGKRLKDSGYLVLDGDYVYAYPGDVEAVP